MFRFRFALAGAGALALGTISTAAQAQACEALNISVCECHPGNQFTSGSEPLRFSTKDAAGNAVEIASLEIRPRRKGRGSYRGPPVRPDGRGRRAGDRGDECSRDRFFSASTAQSGSSSLPFGYDAYMDESFYSVDGQLFANDRLSLSASMGGYRDNGIRAFTGTSNNGFFVGGGLTAYPTKNFAVSSYFDYTSESFSGVSTNSYIGAEFLTFAGAPISFYGGYDRTSFSGSSGINTFTLGLTTYLGASEKSDLRSYHRKGLRSFQSDFR